MSAITGELEIRTLNSPGPISDAFLLSRAFIKIIIGPVGSGKTITALRALRRVAMRQGGRRDARGVLWRKARVGVIRESYPNIEKNTLPSWFRIHPETDGKFTWKAPYTHRLNLVLDTDEAGRPVDVCDFEIEFRAIGDKSVEEACRGWEVVAVLIDEADLQPAELLAFLTGRIGRSSDLDPDLVVDQQIIMSLNAPYMDNWVYGLAIERNLGEIVDPELQAILGDRELIEVFIQPGGLDPEAENLHNLPKGYYKLQAAANKHRPDYVARMLENKFVPMQFGQPVNPQFDFRAHVRPVEWDRSRILTIGLDQGLNAAAAFTQRTANLGLRTLRELVNFREDGKLAKIGAKAFGQALKATLNEHFFDLRPEMVRIVCDPAAWRATDNEDQQMDWVRIVRAELDLPIHKAKSNKPALRNEAIWSAMSERDGYAVDPSCRHLIKGHLGGYRYQKADLADGEKRGHLVIADTVHTHICDAEQYAAIDGETVIAELRGQKFDPSPFVLDSEFDVFAGG